MIDDPNHEPAQGLEDILNYIKANIGSSTVYAQIQEFFKNTLNEFMKNPQWPMSMILKGPFSITTFEGDKIRVYLLEVFAGPPTKHLKREELKGLEKDIIVYSIYMRVDDEDQIVSLVEAVKPH